MASENLAPEEIARRIGMAVAEYNERNPERPITAADIMNKRRGGWLGKVMLVAESAFDALTDQLPADIARLFRNGNIGSGMADRIIERQKQDEAGRIPSYEESIGDKDAINAYGALRDIPSNLAIGGAGAMAGAPFGPLNSFGAGVAAVRQGYGRIARDRFMDDMFERFEKENGRKPDAIEAAWIRRDAGKAADSYANGQADAEAAAQALGGIVARPVSKLAGRLLVDSAIGEAVSPNRSFDGQGIYQGLNFSGAGTGLPASDMSKSVRLDDDIYKSVNLFQQR